MGAQHGGWERKEASRGRHLEQRSDEGAVGIRAAVFVSTGRLCHRDRRLPCLRTLQTKVNFSHKQTGLWLWASPGQLPSMR